MKLHLRIDLGQGPIELATNLFVIVSWERKFKRKASDMANGIGMEDLAIMAYECCKQQNVSVPAIFDDFVKRLIELEIVSEETENPTPGAVSAEA
jgi:predicted transcriptional regulator